MSAEEAEIELLVVDDGVGMDEQILASALTFGALNRMSYAAVGGPNQVVSASASPSWVRFPTQATYPSGRINTAVGAVTAPITGSSHAPPYVASID